MNTWKIIAAPGARAALAGFTAIGIGLGSGACGNVTAGGFSEVTVDVSGDAPTTMLAPSASVQPIAPEPTSTLASGPSRSSHGNEPEGQVEVDFRLVLVSEDGSSVPVGQDDIRVKVDVQGVNEAEAVNELVPAGRYTELRIVFTHIKVEVEGGLVVNGVPIVGEVQVELEGPSLLVSRAIDLIAVDGGSVGMVVDLNTPAWLEALDPVALTIDESIFAALVDVAVR